MYFPSNFPVCGVGLVRNSVDELFVEGTCLAPVCWDVVACFW